MLSAEGKENGQKITTGLISNFARAAHFFVHFYAIVLHDYTRFMEEMSQVFLLPFFYCRSLSLWQPLSFLIFSPPLENFHVVFPTTFLFSLSLQLSVAPFLVELRCPVANFLFFSAFLFLYILYIIVDLTINLSLILQTTRIQKQFPLSVFVFIDTLVISASQDAGGYAISRQNKK